MEHRRNPHESLPLFDRRSFLWLLSLSVVACASRDRTQRYREGDNTNQNTSLTPEDERKLTQEVLPQFQKDYPPLNDDYCQNYLNSIGQKIVQANSLHNNPYQYSFTVVNSPQVNAFALPAGTVFVTAPLITMCESEAELAGVIGHEVGHIKARHTAERMDAAKKAQSQSWKYAIGGGLLGTLAGYGLGQLLCAPNDQKCKNEALKTGAAMGAVGGLLVQRYGFMQNSQEDELEADRIGFRTSYQAGYHRDYVGKFYEKLYRMEQEAKAKTGGGLGPLAALQDALSTHPPSRERIQQIREMQQQVALNSSAVISTNEFLEVKRRLSARAKG
ncbi:MAG: M48 family metalloprotease [Bdellovibrionaceae bacterium]|nr:M48 family metalloprotease [Pseudobdellovibrionaceae bacterium]MDW8190823.1 M48 family metalloprotease [Pseudobdellovibrionaceae bacterium]